ncbi:MAG: hypothetical protein Q4A64_08065 [Porphyromonadaceae bacterium]|nr:hypothetical protein [Porphyromonadaceae bacterium]
MRKLLLLWLAIAATLTSCGKRTSDAPLPDPSREHIPPKVHIYQDEKSSLVEEVLDSGIVIYSEDTPEDKLPKTGEIICSGITKAAPNGFLYKVERVEHKNGKIEVKTSPAHINEAIQEYKGRMPLNLKNSSILSITDAEGRAVKYDRLKASTASRGLAFEVVKTIGDKHFSSDIKLVFSLDADLTLDIERCQMNLFELEVKASAETEVSIKAELKGELKKEVEVYSILLAPVTVMAGPVPIVFSPRIAVLAKFSLDGQLAVSAKILEIQREFTMDYRYTRNPDPQTGRKHNLYTETDSKGRLLSAEDLFEAMTSGWTKDSAGVEAGAEASLVIQPNFSLYNLNKNMGVGFAAEAYVKAGLKMKITPSDPNGVYFTDEAYADTGIEASVNSYMKLPGSDGTEGELKATAYEAPILAPIRLTPKFDLLRTSEESNGVNIFATMELPAFIINLGDFGFMYCKDNPYHEQINKEAIKSISLSSKFPKYSNIKLGLRPATMDLALSIEGLIPIDQLEIGATYYVYPYSEFFGLRLPHKSTKFTIKTKGGGKTPIIIGDDLF